MFIHSSADSHLSVSTFCLLWIMLSWTFEDKFLCGHIFQLSWCVPILELLDYMVTLFGFFKDPLKCFPQQWHHRMLVMYKDSDFFKSLPTLVIVHVYDYSHPVGCQVISHCGFDFIFLILGDVEYHFMYPLAIWLLALEKCLFSFLASF